MKNRIIFSGALALLMISVCGCKMGPVNKTPTINVCNWGEYISNGTEGSIDVNKEFTKETGINVNYSTFQSNEELFAKLSGGGSAYDIIIPSDYLISRLIENNMLEKLNFDHIPNFKFIDNRFINQSYDPENEYSVPYMWGLMGIFINRIMVNESIDEIDWDILWNEKYSKKILMFDNSRDAFGISLMRLGYSINSKNISEWEAASAELIKQRPFVQTYVMDQIYDKMGNGEAAIAPYYSGDAAVMVKNNPNISFVIPKKGTNRFIDAMCIPRGSDHKEEAEKYIDFMCRKNIAMANAIYTGYSTPQREVYESLPNDMKGDKLFYPDDDIILNSEVFVHLPKEINRTIDDLWIQIKTGGENNPIMLIAIIGGFVLLYILVIVYKKNKYNHIKG